MVHYDFSHSLHTQNAVLEEFIDKYITYFPVEDDEEYLKFIEYYEKIFNLFHTSFQDEEMIELFKKLAEYKISRDVPYVIVSNEIHALAHLLVSNINKDERCEDLVNILTLFKDVDNVVAYLYLMRYINNLISMNNTRRNSLSDLTHKNLIVHYESHLLWLSKLALCIKNTTTVDFPELDHCACDFGKWINSDAREVIQNNSKHKNITNIHKNLHLLARKIHNLLGSKENHILINYLEKCELISLSIGTELALIDNTMIYQKVTKDALTGALNRHGLHSIFQTHYELALATSNCFILAICDLDHFKEVNDTYGHVAGDKMLQLFVEIVKKNIRNSDVILRYGGEEFVIMLPSIHKDKGLAVMQKIREDFAASVLDFEEQKIQATVSIGMMEIEPNQRFEKSFIDDYIVQVDQKLYHAKEHGRNRVES